MQGPLVALEQTYINLQQQVSMLSAGCDPQKKQALITQLVAARTAYWSCVNKAFHDDDPQVASLTAQLTDANQKVVNAIQQMGDMSATLDQITRSVSLASQLAKFVIAA